MVPDIVATATEFKTGQLAIFRMLKIGRTITHRSIRLWIDADKIYLTVNPAALDPVVEHCRDMHRGCHRLNLIARDLTNSLHVPGTIGKTLQSTSVKNNIRKNPMNAILHLMGES